MQVASYQLRLRHAPRTGDGKAYERFFSFVEGLNDPHVRLRPDAVVKAAIEEQNLFFLETDQGELIGTTGFYGHGVYPNLWGEIGSTLIHPTYRGFRLQEVMYRYILTIQWLTSTTFIPVFAIVDAEAVSSGANVERCRFDRLSEPPEKLVEAKPQFDWSKVIQGQKRLYQLTREGIVDALSYVAQQGRTQRLINSRSGTSLSLVTEFALLNQSGIADELKSEAESRPDRRLRPTEYLYEKLTSGVRSRRFAISVIALACLVGLVHYSGALDTATKENRAISILTFRAPHFRDASADALERRNDGASFAYTQNEKQAQSVNYQSWRAKLKQETESLVSFDSRWSGLIEGDKARLVREFSEMLHANEISTMPKTSKSSLAVIKLRNQVGPLRGDPESRDQDVTYYATPTPDKKTLAPAAVAWMAIPIGK